MQMATTRISGNVVTTDPLNLETTLDRYPLPGIEDIFNAVGGAVIFSKLDLKCGYHQIPL